MAVCMGKIAGRGKGVTVRSTARESVAVPGPSQSLRGGAMPMRLARVVRRVTTMLEDPQVPFAYHAATFAAAFAVRMLLETVSVGADHTTILQIAHYGMFYVSLALWFMLLFRLLTGEPIERIGRVVLPCFIIIPIVPLLDMLVSGGSLTSITYLLPGKHDDLLLRFLTFFGKYDGFGSSYGMRVEIALVLVAACAYCWYKTGRLAIGLLGALGVYIVIFLHAIIPFGLQWAGDALGIATQFSDNILVAAYLLSYLVSGTAVALLAWPTLIRSLASDNRLPRVAHYLLMLGAGSVIAGRVNTDSLTLEQFLLRLLAPAAILLACHSAMIANNLVDLEIDRISNPERPLVIGAVDSVTYARAAWVLGVLALVYALAIGPLALLVVFAFLGGCFLYSMPPLRLKRVPVLSKFFIACNSYALFLLGATLGNVSWRVLADWYLPFFLVGFTLAINFIDLKDVEGDRHAGISTLPVLIGESKSKLLIGLFFAGTYLSLHLVFHDVRLLLALVAASALMFLFVTRTPYREGPVFAIYLASLVGFIVYLASWAPLPKLVDPTWSRQPMVESSMAPGPTATGSYGLQDHPESDRSSGGRSVRTNFQMKEKKNA